MAVVVVDLLEKVDVDHGQGERAQVALRFLKGTRQLILEVTVVVELGQAVSDREQLQPLVRLDELVLQVDDPLTGPDPR